jgi:hypothetical protein
MLIGAWTLALSRSLFTAEAAQDVNPAGLIPLFPHKPATAFSLLDPLDWYPDKPSAVPELSSSSSSQSSSSYSQSSSSSTSQSSASQSSSASASASSFVGSLSAAGSSSVSVSNSSEEDIIAPASVARSVSTSASDSASRASSSSIQKSVCEGKSVSVESVDGEFCIEGSSICSGTDGEGECPGVQPGLSTGSHCAEVRIGVYGCQPGPKSARTVRLRQ